MPLRAMGMGVAPPPRGPRDPGGGAERSQIPQGHPRRNMERRGKSGNIGNGGFLPMRRLTRLLISGLVLLPVAVACSASSSKTQTIAIPSVHEIDKMICQFAYRCCEQGEVGF